MIKQINWLRDKIFPPKEKVYRYTQSELQSVFDAYSTQRAIQNPLMGIGGSNDLIHNTYINAPTDYSKEHLTALYIKSWVAAKIIDLLVDDVFSAGIIRQDDPKKYSKLIDLEKTLKLWEKIPSAVKAGRLYGTAFLIFCPRDANFERDLIPEEVKKGDISNIVVVDKFAMSIHETNLDPAALNYGHPYSYRWTISPNGAQGPSSPLTWEGHTIVSATRCVRFDGIASLCDEGWLMPENLKWGFSTLTRVMDDIMLDMLLAATGGDVAKRVAVPVLKIKGFRDMLGVEETIGDEASPEMYAQSLSANISANRMAFIDAADEIENLEVGNPEGVVAITESQMNRLANAAGVPVSRFTGVSASGLNATGSGDARDYRMAVESYRERNIDPKMEFIMDVMSKNAGLQETPKWEWGRLGELTAMEEAETLRTTSESISLLVSSGLLTEKEGRRILNALENVNVDADKVPPKPAMPPAPGIAGGQLGRTPTKNPISNAKKKPPVDNRAK